MTLLLVAVAGALGAVARVVLDAAVTRRLAVRWPSGTAVINVLGSLLLGAVTGLALRADVSEQVRLALGTGFCGAFTTFSTASLELVRLLEERRGAAALAYAVGGLLAALGAAALGLALTGGLHPGAA